MSSPFGTLKSALTPRLLGSDLNAANLPFIDTGHDTGAQMATDDALNDRLATRMGAGPAVHALRQAADESRMQHTNDQLYAQADEPLTTSLADMGSEANYARQQLPYARFTNDQKREEATQDAVARYAVPAQIKAQGDLLAAQAGAQGRIGAATAREGNLSVKGLYDALATLMGRTGTVPTADQLAQLKAAYGVK